ncbi:MAG: tRNA (guanosine(37)-N1)-methyltransferase TrmD [Burkholderiales bacterium]|jgi:tRNA (guanine37-N1)-methyltransferase|nr:tRNA (guanosine(37)-N1)-methyltransferase TrmD [Burkholderiales bacterium]
MRIDVITLFPEMIEPIGAFGVVGRARLNGLWALNTINPRDFVHDPHKTVDDRPYGGGPGMVMLASPLREAVWSARDAQRAHPCTHSHVIYLSPSGARLTHEKVISLYRKTETGTGLILLAGRYEGVDERFLAQEVDEEISIGDFVVSGGELPALLLMDALVRQIPGALNDAASKEEESFTRGLLDYPHYTRPENYRGMIVPEVLRSGHHGEIARWRLAQSLHRTLSRRPDLIDARGGLSDAEKALMKEYPPEIPLKT